MIESKISFLKGLDQDTSVSVLPRDAYIDALNITRDSFSKSHDFSAVNVVGNRLVSYNWPEGDGKVVGAKANELRGTVIFMRYNSNGYDGIYEYNKVTRVITKIFECLTDSETNVLNFNTIDKITSIDIYNREEGDLLFFLDCLGRPTTLNIDRFKNGEYTPVTRDIINVIKNPPLNPPKSSYGNDTTKRTNSLRNKLFKFQQIWVYDDFEESVCSPESAVPYPLNILDDTYTNEITNNNVINITLSSGPKNVKDVKLLMSLSEGSNDWSDFVVVESISKSEKSIEDNSIFSIDFYNDGVYPVYDLERRIQLFDYVPKYAKSQAMPNGNVLTYASTTFGLSRELSPDVDINVLTVPAGNGSSVGSLSVNIKNETVSDFLAIYLATFTGTPAVGTVVNIKMKHPDTGSIITVSSYVTVSGDTVEDVVDGLVVSISNVVDVVKTAYNRLTIASIRFPNEPYLLNTIEILSPSGSSTSNSIATFPFSTSRRLGFAYFDKSGITNGILYNESVTFPAYDENGSQQVLLPYINLEINHQPPIWAHSYQILLTKDESKFVYWFCSDVDTSEAEFIYFDVTGVNVTNKEKPTVASVLEWIFQDGDRLRVIRNMDSDTVLGDTFDTGIVGIITDPIVNGSAKTGRFIKIRKYEPFTSYPDWGDKEFVLQIYRPSQQQAGDEVLTYYELGQQYNIINPETDDRAHGGNTQNQEGSTPAIVDIYEGDVYFRIRSVYTSATSSGQATYYIQDRNFVDFQISAVSSISGRPNVIDVNAKETYFGNEIRHGEAYQPNTNINGLNRFPSLSFIEVDFSYGDVMRMFVWERSMRIFQRLKVGVVPLFNQIMKQPNGDNVTVNTSQLLNPINYYQGNYGIGDAAESLVGYNNANYFCDTNRGIVCRVAENGVTPISVIFKMNSWATQNISLRDKNAKIYGVYEPKSNNYIISLEKSLLENSLAVGVQETLNYEGQYQVAAFPVFACNAELSTYYHATPFGIGTIIYSDKDLTSPVTGNTVIVKDGQLYSLDITTGEILSEIEGAICGIGIAGIYAYSVTIDEICERPTTTLYTENEFGVGEVMYIDSSLTTERTGFNYLLEVSTKKIYTLDSSTGEVLTETAFTCESGIAGVYKFGNELETVCSEPASIKYTGGEFGIGSILYNSSSLATPVTGFTYMVNVDTGNIYTMDSVTGEVLAYTGDDCTSPTIYYYSVNNSYSCPDGPYVAIESYVASYVSGLTLKRWYYSGAEEKTFFINTFLGTTPPSGGPWPFVDSGGSLSPVCPL